MSHVWLLVISMIGKWVVTSINRPKQNHGEGVWFHIHKQLGTGPGGANQLAVPHPTFLAGRTQSRKHDTPISPGHTTLLLSDQGNDLCIRSDTFYFCDALHEKSS